MAIFDFLIGIETALMHVATMVEYLIVEVACFLLPFWRDRIGEWYEAHIERLVDELEEKSYERR